MNDQLTYNQIFVPGGYPKYTYNPRKDLDLEDKVGSVLSNLCKLVVVTGHTKSGKTVLVRKILPENSAVWIDGGGVGDENDFWTTIIDQLELFQATEVHRENGTSAKVSGEMSADAGIPFIKGGVKTGGSIGSTNSASLIQVRKISSRMVALRGLRLSKRPLVIDDFHYLPRELQGSMVRALKPLIFDGLPVVFIAIPHRRYDAVKVEKEMTGRIFSVNIPLWEIPELKFIPETGFDLLNVKLDEGSIKYLAEESIGSPHLMQEFCREICKIHPITITDKIINISKEELERAFVETAEMIGRPIFEKLARGPRARFDRKRRKLKDGKDVDIYGLVLQGLSHIKPGLVTLEYEGLRTAIKEICVPDDVPNIQEIARVLKHMSEIAATDQSSTPVIDFDEGGKLLHITDPFFAFYLRWGSINK